MKYYHKSLLLLLLGCSFFINVNAQTFDSFKKQQKQDYKAFKKAQQKDFEEFKKERQARIRELEKKFTQYLRNSWDDFEAEKGLVKPEKPGPQKVPSFNEQEAPKRAAKLDVKQAETKTDQPDPIELPVLTETPDKEVPESDEQFTFFGTPATYSAPDDLIPDLPGTLKKKAIADAWQQMTNKNYQPVLEQALAFQQTHNLNDWGYYLYIKQLSNQIAEAKSNEAVFLRWFLLTKSNYDSRLGFDQQNLYLLLPSRQEIYGNRYFRVANKRYYLVGRDAANLTIYRKNYPTANQIMDLTVRQAPNLALKPDSTTINFKGKTVTIGYNRNLIDFYNAVPTAELEAYFNSTPATVTKESINNALQPLLEGLSQTEKVNLLLDFVQQFDYQKDGKQFGREKFFFPAEVFHYPFSDCEDNAVLLSYLIQELVALPVVGLEYPNHVATAVQLKEAGERPSFRLEGDPYFLCDPTYKGASMGMVIPRCRDKEPGMVRVAQERDQEKRREKLWQIAREGGGYRGANHENTAFAENDDAYITGYFKDRIKIGDEAIKANNASKNAFIARFDRDNQVKWVKALKGKGPNLGYHVDYAQKQGKVLVAGSFHNQCTLEGEAIRTPDKPNVFTAALKPSGQVEWLSQGGLTKLEKEGNANYVMSFSPKGQHNWTRLYNESEHAGSRGLHIDGSGQVFVKGSLSGNAGLRTPEPDYASGREVNAVSLLKHKADKLRNKGYNATVTGLFAVVELVRNTGFVLEGKEVQQALDKYNPDFKSGNPTIYENIGKIRFLKNANGVVTIQTHSGDAVSFSNMEISSGARLNLITYESGNVKLEVLSGIEVGKAIVWYELNAIKLHRQKPDLVFNYSDDHAKKTVSLNEIID
jgi:hypothetical protein